MPLLTKIPKDILGCNAEAHRTRTPMEVTKMIHKIKTIITTAIELFVLALFCLMVVVV